MGVAVEEAKQEEDDEDEDEDEDEDNDDDDLDPSKASLLVDIDVAYASNVEGRNVFRVVAGLSIIGGRSYISSSDCASRDIHPSKPS